MAKKLITSKEITVGRLSVGYVSSDFKKYFGDISFEPKVTPTFQKLHRAMTDTEIEREFKLSFCELGDVFAFLQNPPEECKDGYANLFYFPSCVVDVDWRRFYGEWRVYAWERGDRQWGAGSRVFSPATSSSITRDLALEPSETLNLEKAIEIVKNAGYQVAKII